MILNYINKPQNINKYKNYKEIDISHSVTDRTNRQEGSLNLHVENKD